MKLSVGKQLPCWTVDRSGITIISKKDKILTTMGQECFCYLQLNFPMCGNYFKVSPDYAESRNNGKLAIC